jgi:hypothetical protein
VDCEGAPVAAVNTPELVDKSVEQLRQSLNYLLGTAADSLRNAVADFNDAPISVSAVDTFRERVLRVADHLAAPLPDAPTLTEQEVRRIVESGGQIHRIRESRRVEG